MFPTAIKTGRRLASPNFVAIISKEAKGYAVVIPKKVARLSVTRHRMKRHVLEALQTLSLPKSLLLFPKSSVLSLGYRDIQTELAALLSKIK